MKTVGEVLKIARLANMLTLKEVNENSGVSTIYINELECGRKENISNEYLSKLANAYNLSAEQVIELQNYYTSLEDVEEKRRKRLTLAKALEMIENNLSK